MKSILTLLVFLAMLGSACTPMQPTQSADAQAPDTTSDAMPAVAAPLATLPATADVNVELPSEDVALPVDGVTLSDNGKVFTMQVGESFLLNLGMDVYDWTVDVDHQDVLQREVNKTVIHGAQGIYMAQAPGTAILSATGDPLCLQSKPACMMPSILFSITVIVK